MKGIDISQGSGGIDFHGLKRNGYDFVIARAGWGSSADQADPNFESYVRGALDAGLHVGSYWFIYARTIPEAQQNAVCFDQILKPFRGKIDFPVYIDYEYDSTRYYEKQTGNKETSAVATQMINVAALQMERLGWYTGVYLNPDYIQNHVDYDVLRRYTLWLAEWKNPGLMPSYQCGVWQYSGDTKIIDAQGGVDLNLCYQTDFSNVIRAGGFNGFTKDHAAGIEAAPEISVGGHGIYGRPTKILENGTWMFLD